MANLSLADFVCCVEGLLGLLASFADPEALCCLEAAAERIEEAFERSSAGFGEAPWRTASWRRGFQIGLEAGIDGASAHRFYKRFFGSLRGISLPPHHQWLVQGSQAALSLEKVAARFAERCEGCPTSRHLLDFTFNPEEVRETAAGDASIGPPPRPSQSTLIRGDYEPRLGIEVLRLEVSKQAMLTRMLTVEQALFLEVRLRKPVPESTWLEVMVWAGSPCDAEGRCPVVASDLLEPDMLRVRLPSRCASVGVVKVADGSPLHSALLSHGNICMLLAFCP